MLFFGDKDKRFRPSNPVRHCVRRALRIHTHRSSTQKLFQILSAIFDSNKCWWIVSRIRNFFHFFSHFRLETFFCAFLWLYDNSLCIYSNIYTQTVGSCQMCWGSRCVSNFYGNDFGSWLAGNPTSPFTSLDVCEFFLGIIILFRRGCSRSCCFVQCSE